MQNNYAILKSVLSGLLMLPISIYAIAQKLPNKQEVSLRAPANIKINGKPTEWGKMQAYNDATGVYYTIANDDDNLYLVMQARDYNIVDKIVGMGATLTIQKMGKSNPAGAVSITYPASTTLSFSNSRDRIARKDTSAKTTDSLMRDYNARLGQQCKQIGVRGIKDVDTLISAYNEDGIKVACLFNNKQTFTLELSITLKQLGLTAADATKFAYHLKLNGKKLLAMKVSLDNVRMGDTGLPPGPEIDKAELQASMDHLMSSIAQRDGPTDFWAEYTLAKKPL